MTTPPTPPTAAPVLASHIAPTVADALAFLLTFTEQVTHAEGALAWARENGEPLAAHERWLAGRMAGLAGACHRYAATFNAHNPA
jgi:hypothetical protein